VSSAWGIVLWLWYGIRVDALPLIVANAVTLTIAVAILFLKWRYGRDSLPRPWRRRYPRTSPRSDP
jgi:MtN3 and saliva related transmembrane protein